MGQFIDRCSICSEAILVTDLFVTVMDSETQSDIIAWDTPQSIDIFCMACYKENWTEEDKEYDVQVYLEKIHCPKCDVFKEGMVCVDNHEVLCNCGKIINVVSYIAAKLHKIYTTADI